MVSLADAKKGLAILEGASNHAFVPVALVKLRRRYLLSTGLQLEREGRKAGEAAEGRHENVLFRAMLHGRERSFGELEVHLVVDVPTAPMALVLQLHHQQPVFVILWS